MVSSGAGIVSGRGISWSSGLKIGNDPQIESDAKLALNYSQLESHFSQRFQKQIS